ncbi:hypothetical protein HOC32_03930, partial [Candidatus Woesearchaeota archaeon]|nr:hypothetical protein [Candidatus Woesearchaeota archaeon]
MRVRQTVKRLFAVATGAAMLGATAMGALAADLGDYPTMFVEDGTYNGFFVVGENAASVDNLAMTDIATSMMAPGSGSGVSVDVDGDAWLVGTSAEWLELNESIGPTGTNGIVDFIDGGDLAALGDGTFSNSKGSYDFEQKLFFDKTTGAGGPHAIFEENDDDVLDVFWKIASDDQIARYQLNFVTDAETDIDASDSQSLDDFEDKSFTFMGTSWTMTTARYTVNSGGTVALTFMGGATLATLSEGDSGSYTVDGTDYDVAVTFVDADEVAFVVNGEATGKLNDGETYTLADGNDVGVSNILYQDYAGGIHSADFFLGANKLYMTDNISDTAASGTEIKVNEETIDGAVPYIKGTVVTGTTDTSTDGELKIDLIEVNMTAQDDIWLSAGDKLSTDSELEESGLLFTENWDMEFHGFQDEEATNDIMLQKSGDDKYKLAFTAGDGSSVEVPLMYATGSNIYTGDKAGDNLALSLTNVTDDDYFVLNSKDAATAGNDDAVTTVLQ